MLVNDQMQLTMPQMIIVCNAARVDRFQNRPKIINQKDGSIHENSHTIEVLMEGNNVDMQQAPAAETTIVPRSQRTISFESIFGRK